MVQLKVYDGSDQYFLDLLSNDPIKLTLSIEDITNTDARSTFSRTFRVPSTVNNNQFFKNAFLVDGIDFDVTVKKQAEILYNGAEYKVGHIRLQKIYHNKMERNTEYEIVFLGETRDFGSVLGEKTLAELDLSAYDHPLNYNNVRLSWQAYPEGGTNDGLFNGDILYPLVDYGTSNGESRIAYQGANAFNHDNASDWLRADRFKPMIRAKALWDKIFEEAGFTYSSAIAESNDFRQLYISAWGNDPEVFQQVGSENELDVRLSADFGAFSTGIQRIPWDVELVDPADNYNTISYQYQVPVTGPYEIEVRTRGNFSAGSGGGAAIQTHLMKNGQIIDSSNITNVPAGDNIPYVHSILYSGSFNQNDLIYVEIEFSGQGDLANVEATGSTFFRIPKASGNINVGVYLNDDYKQIDFIRDMLTKFRLVMAPDKIDPKKFIVEPWVDYIASGDLLDWSDKLDESRDLQLEPLFFTQSARLEFTDKEDADYLNEVNMKKFKEVFGTLKIDSGNELLKGTRNIETNFATTPITQIEGAPNSNFLIALVHAHDQNEDGTLNHDPIKPITRILFYNGLFTQGPASAFPQSKPEWWFYDDTVGVETGVAQFQFPMISYWQDFDAINGPGPNTINMNWQIEPGYANTVPGYNFDYAAGVSMYDAFWKDYINSLYSKFARRLTGYFALSVEDLFNFSFDDVIFVNGSYYRPEKLTDVVVGQKSLVKVDLIKLLNYGLNLTQSGGDIGVDPIDEPADPVTYTDSNGHVYTTESTVWEMTPCDDPQATPIIVGPANMSVQAGQSAVVNNECYTFEQPVFWQESYQTPIEVSGTQTYADCATCECATASTLTVTVTNTSDATCNQNNGTLTFISAGGVAPFTYVITDGVGNTVITVTRNSHITNNLMSLGSDTYTVTATDACGNTASDTGIVFDDCGSNGPSGG